MQVKETQNDGLKRGYQMTLPAADLATMVDQKLKEAQPEVEMKGFRKGKVPMAMLKKQFGPRVMGDAMQDSIDGALREHLEKSGDRPAVQPKIEMQDGENWKEGDDVIVNVSYEILPEIPEVDLAKLKLERLVVKAEDAAVTEALENLAKNAKSYEDKRKGSKAAKDDQVVIDFKGSVDGELFEGGTAEDYPLVLGSGSFIPGFEDQLTGAKAGDEVEVKVQFPADYGHAALAGKDAVFATTVKAVKKPVDAKIDDELAKRFGAESLDKLKEQIGERLESEYKGASRAVMKRALLDQLDGLVKFDLPDVLVEAEAGQIAHQLYHEEHPDDHGHEHGAIEPTDEHKKLAERRVRLGLLLAEVGQKAEVQVSDQEFTQAVMMQARQFPGQERQFFEFIQQNPQAQQQLRAPIFEDKVVDHIAEQAKVKDKEVSKEDLEKAVEALDEL
ncbi:MAG TPA: trigger factor [Paracoccus sp. (in: a-proteobacteria)]|uniref:trigger factor n=1 Tax=uncultured Paracoccus sp. TaxID=189685 RepID=UPI0026100868|nr:trigger factor [uncultured Paracoccus sp.]HMQ41863.1 trigger factor [Paracoccus sp. (in: a-proteobacteria)]HMR35663.1 trigger factor [Paracoccus sp. (in: a-proteobacteria)]